MRALSLSLSLSLPLSRWKSSVRNKPEFENAVCVYLHIGKSIARSGVAHVLYGCASECARIDQFRTLDELIWALSCDHHCRQILSTEFRIFIAKNI